MFGSEVLDVVVGVLFVYFTLSIICSAIQEVIATFLRLRAQDLYQGIKTLLDDSNGSGLVRDFYNHPLIDTLFSGNYEPGSHHNLPSYIPARAFALAIMDLSAPRSASGAVSGAAGATAVGTSPFMSPLRDNLSRSSLAPSKVSQALLTLSDAAGGDAAGIRQNIEQWYNNAMERVSSAYKRKTQIIILAVGCIVAAAVNADSIGIVSALSTNKAVRDSLVASATQITAANAAPAEANPTGAANQANPPARANPAALTDLELFRVPACRVDAASADCRLMLNLNRIRDSGLPIGWVQDPVPGDLRGAPSSPASWLQKVIGLLLTDAAVSMGAPFWFDLLNKVAVIRSAIKPAEGEPGSKGSAAGAAS